MGEAMQCGLFGKLPQKRDFVAVSVPRDFLHLWEAWIENCLAESQRQLERQAWIARFAAAPIWRFFLGRQICGLAVRGAFMPSMDGLGRYFPLTLLAWREGGAHLAPPAVEPACAWFDKAEELLLSTLKPDVSLEATTAALMKLAAVAEAAEAAPERFFVAGAELDAPALALRDVFGGAAANGREAPVDPAQMTYWWTLGADADRPWAWSRKAMPEPQQFAAMLSGRFSDVPHELFRA